MKKKIYYWTPFIDNVATIYASANSSTYLQKFYKNFVLVKTLNVFGEWDKFKDFDIKFQTIKLTDYEIIKKFPFRGFAKSRIKYLLIGFFSIIPLFKLLKKEKPDYLIIHLISYIPLLLLLLFNFKTKFILRISGLPHLNILRKFFWKLIDKKIFHVTCPTDNTYRYLLDKKIFSHQKLSILKDPAIIFSKILNKKEEKIEFDKVRKKNYFVAVGRLTFQKNFLFLIRNIKNLLIENNFQLVIIGEGEERKLLEKYINDNGLKEHIFLIGYSNNIFPYLKNAKALISTSRWEDPGVVLLEAASVNLPIISSDCISGPREFLENDKNGFGYTENDDESFKLAINSFLNASPNAIRQRLIGAKKKLRNFTVFSHSNELFKILNK